MFAVIHVEAIPDHLRGYVSRFLQEVQTGLYVGVVTDKVLDDLWQTITEKTTEGTATLVLSAPDLETGYDLRLHRSSTHRIVNIDGINLPIAL